MRIGTTDTIVEEVKPENIDRNETLLPQAQIKPKRVHKIVFAIKTTETRKIVKVTTRTEITEIIDTAEIQMIGTKKMTEMMLPGGTYGIHYDDMVQFRKEDRQRQRPIRRQ